MPTNQLLFREDCDCYQRLIVLSSGATGYQDTR